MSDEMKHPPIPPGCKNFEDLKNGRKVFSCEQTCVCFQWRDENQNSVDNFTYHLKLWRAVIAAVARCAWMDEGVLAQIEMERNSVKAHSIEWKKQHSRYCESLRNETAWAKWQKGEPWK